MSEQILDTKNIPQTATAFDTAAGLQFANEDEDGPVEVPAPNGRTMGRYARQGVNYSDCRYGC